MNYNTFRVAVQDGDLIFIKPKSVWSRFITFITGGSFSHCGIALWLTDGISAKLFIVEAVASGRRLVSMRYYSNRSLSLLRVGLEYSPATENMLFNTGYPYGWWDFISVGIKELLLRVGITSFFLDGRGEICSEFVAKVLRKYVSKFEQLDTHISPSRLYSILAEDSPPVIEYKV